MKDPGRTAYEAEIAKNPNYTATGKPRPSWEQLSEHSKQAWRDRYQHA